MMHYHCGNGNCTVTFWTFSIVSVCHSQKSFIFLQYVWVTMPYTVSLFTIFITGQNITVSHSVKVTWSICVFESVLLLEMVLVKNMWLSDSSSQNLYSIWNIFVLGEKGWRKSDKNLYVWQSYLILMEIFCNNITSGTCHNNIMNSFMRQSLFTPAVNYNEMLQCSL